MLLLFLIPIISNSYLGAKGVPILGGIQNTINLKINVFVSGGTHCASKESAYRHYSMPYFRKCLQASAGLNVAAHLAWLMPIQQPGQSLCHEKPVLAQLTV